MKRTRIHSLDPGSARSKIAAAKANKRFVAALLDRDHHGHRDAVGQWTRLHEAAFTGKDHTSAREVSSHGQLRGGAGITSASPGRANSRLELADSGIDDWEADRAREARGHRSAESSASDGLPRTADQRPASSAIPGLWIVDERGRDFVLVNPVTDLPLTDDEGERITASPETFGDAVPPAVRPFNNALMNIWQIDRIPDDVAVGTESGVAFGIMLDMLRVRQMTVQERRDLQRRIAELPERYGRDWSVVSGHLRGRLQRAIAEPFRFPAIMTDEELEAHLSVSRTLESIGEIGRTAGPIAGSAAARRQSTILGTLGRAVPFALATGAAVIVDEHYESRAEAYEAEIRRRRLPNVWPPAPD